MNKVMAVSILFFSLLSCKNNDNIVRFRAIDESLRNSNLLIMQENDNIYRDMDNKLRDPQTLYKAKIWQPKTLQMKKLSADISIFIDSLKINLKKGANFKIDSTRETYSEEDKNSVTLLFEKQDKATDLSHKLTDFKQMAIGVIKPDEFSDNPILQKDLVRFIDQMKISILPDAGNEILGYFKNSSALEAITLLDKIRNDIVRAENMMLNYYNSMIVPTYHGFTEYLPLINQNSTYLKAGQLLEINAGVGAYSAAAKPKITINGNEISIDAAGTSTLKLKINNKPGKYFIPVRVEYIKPDGSQYAFSKNIEYIVAE